MPEPVIIVPYDPNWPDRFAKERDRILSAIGSLTLAIEHTGSTSVPGLAAKPVIDMVLTISELNSADMAIGRLEQIGYEYRPIGDLPGRLFLRRFVEGERRFHLSLSEPNSRFWIDHLAFRDYLQTHPEAANAYAALKLDLAERYRLDRGSYTEGKSAFIARCLEAHRAETES